MNALFGHHRPQIQPIAEAGGTVHAWSAEPLPASRAPVNGFYAVGRQPAVYLRRGEILPGAAKRWSS